MPDLAHVPANDLRRAAMAQRGELLAAITRVVDSGWYVMGPEHDAFEAELAAFVGVSHAVGVANGTDALELALLAAGCRAGDRVITVANAGGYTSTASRKLGAIPLYVDVDPASHNMDPNALKVALRQRAGAVVVTHLYGALADVEEIATLCQTHGVPLIEDCAQAIGARRAHRRAGSFGDLATFSFYPTKNLGALGDGGAVVTSDGAIATRVRQLRQYGWDRKYVVGRPDGRNSRLDEMQAAVLRVRLAKVDALNERRRAIHAEYIRALATGPERMLHASNEAYVAHLAVLTSPRRDQVRDKLAGAGVATDVHYPVPDHQQPLVAGALADVTLPVTERAAAEVLTLPCFPELRDDEVDRVCSALAALKDDSA